MKRVFAADLRPGDQVVDLFRVTEVRLAPYRDESKGHYLHLVLADRSGQVEARLWEGAEEVARWLAAGQVVHVRARAALYRDRMRLRLESVAPAEEVEWSLAELVPLAAVDTGEALAAIHAAVDRVASPPLQALLRSFFGDGQFVEAFCSAPAAAPGQLLARTAQLLDLAGPLPRWSSDLDVDLLLTAILLHEVGQTADLGMQSAGRPGAWLDNALLSDQLVVEHLAQLPDFPPELALRLRHAIAAAGRPDRCRIAEAALLARLRALQAVLWQPWQPGGPPSI